MDKRERLRLGLMIDRVQEWVTAYVKVSHARDGVKEEAQAAAKTLLGRVAQVRLPGDADDALPFSALGLKPGDTTRLAALARYVRLPVISAEDEALVSQLGTEVPAALKDARRIAEGSGMFGRRPIDEDAADAAEFLFDYGQWGQAEGMAAAIERIAAPSADDVAVTLDEALESSVGLAALLVRRGAPELVDGAPFASLADELAKLRERTSYGASIDGALAPVKALEPLAKAMPATVTQVIVCSPAGRSAADLLAYLTEVTKS
ncbi:MAG: hypothetical protein FWD83_08735 [Promicromonosporaceae bacterium]|nr:hypothetical protein [Promicromonosporaceae bacterium]